jgi:hypothetical protein
LTKQLLIGGQALVELGLSRHTRDINYLIKDQSSPFAFIVDTTLNIGYVNANGSTFLNAVWQHEQANLGSIASPQALLELQAYSFVRHSLEGNWNQADEAEFDIKFLARKFSLTGFKIIQRFVSETQSAEIRQIIDLIRK